MIDDSGQAMRSVRAPAIAVAVGAMCLWASPLKAAPPDEPVTVRRSSPFLLPGLGPVPLRFLVTPPPIRSNTLPPLAMSDPVVIPPTNSVTESPIQPIPILSSPPDTNAPSLAAASTPAPMAKAAGLPETNSAPPSASTPLITPLFVDTNEAPVLSPQMLVRFFTQPGSTNRNVSVIMPVGFDPARPVSPPSSSATYTTP
jgi:hypothetical protein